MAEDIRKSRLEWIKRELEQVGVAMSLVGTRRQKLIEMARLVTPAFNALNGDRPEIKKVRDDMRRKLHNLRRSNTTPKQSSKNMKATAVVMRDVIKLADKGMLNLPEEYDLGPIVIVNSWGYMSKELKKLTKDLIQAMGNLKEVGLYNELVYGVIQLDPDEAAGEYLAYILRDDTMAADPGKFAKGQIFKAFGERLWDSFDSKDRKVWGGSSHSSRFVQAFSDAMSGRRLDRETQARLQITVGSTILSGGEK